MYKSFYLTLCFYLFFATHTASAQSLDQNADAQVATYFQSIVQPQIATGALKPAKPIPNRTLTPMLMYAKAHWDKLSPSTKALVQPFFFRPTDAGATSPVAGVSLFTQANELTLNSAHFRFHYVTTGSNATTTAFVQQLATEADNVWLAETGTLGFNAPPSDGTIGGGNNLYDIYLLDVGIAGIYGYVTGDQQTLTGNPFPNSIHTYMVLDNDFAQNQFGYNTALTPAQVTLAHEFFHSIQNGYDNQEFPAFFESLSTWMEDKVYPAIKDNLQYIGETFTDTNGNGQYDQGEPFQERPRSTNNKRESGSQDYPELPLDSFGLTPSGLEQYGRFMWIRYLSDKFGNALINSILTKTGQTPGNNTYAAIDAALQAAPYNTTLATAFHEFGIWNINTSLYQKGIDYPMAWVDKLFQSGINISNNATPSLQQLGGKQPHLSTIYERVKNPTGTFTFTTSGSAKVSVITQATAGGAYNPAINIPLTAGQGSWTALAGTGFVTFVISNTSPTDNAMTWQLTDGATTPAPALTPTGPIFGTPPPTNPITTILNSSSSGGGCIATPPYFWLYLTTLGLLLFRRKRLATN